MNWWLAKGPPDNWIFSFDHGNLWGVTPAYANSWRETQPGDKLLFYALAPAKGIIGSGNIVRTWKDEKPFWPTETRTGMSLWTLRITFMVERLLPRSQWEENAVRVTPSQSGRQRSFHRLSETVARDLVKSLS